MTARSCWRLSTYLLLLWICAGATAAHGASLGIEVDAAAGVSVERLVAALRLRLGESWVVTTDLDRAGADPEGVRLRLGPDASAVLISHPGGEPLLVHRPVGGRDAALIRPLAVAVALALRALPLAPRPDPPSLETLALAPAAVKVARGPMSLPTCALRLVASPTLSLAPEASDAAFGMTFEAAVALAPPLFGLLGSSLGTVWVARRETATARVLDRTFWAGGGYEIRLGEIAMMPSVAAQYTFPVLDAEGEGDVALSEQARSSRWALRAAVDLIWPVTEHFALAAGVSAATTFLERSYLISEREGLELGTLLLAARAGIGVEL